MKIQQKKLLTFYGQTFYIIFNFNLPIVQITTHTDTNTESVSNSEDLLPREPCLQALRALRQSKWFQVCFCFFDQFYNEI